MRKTLLVFLIILQLVILVYTSQAQILTYGQFTYSEDIKVEGSPRSLVQERAWEWCASRYKFAREMPKKKRKSSERIVSNAWNNIYLPSAIGPQAVKMFYTLEITASDHQLSFQITNIHYQLHSNEAAHEEPAPFSADVLFGKMPSQLSDEDLRLADKYLDASNAYFDQLISSLRSSIKYERMIAKK
jgi:hypothetical protein